MILRNSAVAGNRPESPAWIYINPGGLEGVRVRINRFIPIPIVVGPVWGYGMGILYVCIELLVRSVAGKRPAPVKSDRLKEFASW